MWPNRKAAVVLAAKATSVPLMSNISAVSNQYAPLVLASAVTGVSSMPRSRTASNNFSYGQVVRSGSVSLSYKMKKLARINRITHNGIYTLRNVYQAKMLNLYYSNGFNTILYSADQSKEQQWRACRNANGMGFTFFSMCDPEKYCLSRAGNYGRNHPNNAIINFNNPFGINNQTFHVTYVKHRSGKYRVRIQMKEHPNYYLTGVACEVRDLDDIGNGSKNGKSSSSPGNVYFGKYMDSSLQLWEANYAGMYQSANAQAVPSTPSNIDGWYDYYGNGWASTNPFGGTFGHLGIDMRKNNDSELHPIFKGIVVANGLRGSNGNIVVLKHIFTKNGRDYTFFSHYSHMSKITVSNEGYPGNNRIHWCCRWNRILHSGRCDSFAFGNIQRI